MKKGDRKYRRNGIAVACYVLAALMLIFVFYTIGTTVASINQTYSQYGMKPTPMVYIMYSFQSAMQPLFYTVVLFMLGNILDAVRKNNKANYKSDEELAAEAEAKRLAREEKKEAKEAEKVAKSEAAVAQAAGVPVDGPSVEEDFMKSLDAELKADVKKPEYRKPRSTGRNSGSKQNSGKQGEGKKSGGSKAANSSEAKQSSKAANKSSKGEGKADAKKTGSGNSARKSGGSGTRKSSRKPAADKPTSEKPAADKPKAVEAAEPVTENKE